MFEQNLGTFIYQFVTIGLIALFIISLALFIRRLLINQSRLQSKLDKVITLLEDEKRSK